MMGGMGGGDVKLMAAIGAIMGYPFILDAMFYSIMFGGFVALLVLAWKKTLIKSLKNVFRAILTFLIPGIFSVPLNAKDSYKIPYGFCIAVGTLFAYIITEYFQISFFNLN